MLAVQMIRKKRDGGTLDDAEIRAFVAGISDGSIPDYQVSAMAMAILFRDMTDRELAVWAAAMTHSGDVVDLTSIHRPKIDKHSTGGVGDKVSIPLAPAVAACGVAVPMVSGRGLGHTGGTLDKLESIPGFRVDLPVDTFRHLVDTIGVCMIGQTARIAPADKRLYALRDASATVESVPLIASSIMSKKIAEGIDGLVIDCKVGRGAFMKTTEDARTLCARMRAIGTAAGKRITSVLTDMNAPIGRTIGNSLEIRESIEVLRGGGPGDTRELTHVLGAEMLMLAGVVADQDSGRARIEAALTSGAALAVFRNMVAAQGGDPRVCDSPSSILPMPRHRTELHLRPGRVTAIDSEALGIAALLLGAGRRTKDDVIDPSAGIVVDAYLGEIIEPGAPPQIVLHHSLSDLAQLVQARAMVERAFTIETAEASIHLPTPSSGVRRPLEVPDDPGKSLTRDEGRVPVEPGLSIPPIRRSRILEVIR